MYNEKIKRDFIDDYTNNITTKSRVIGIFSRFERYEQEWGMDLSQQTTELLQATIDDFSGVRSRSTELILVVLKSYVTWCIKNGYDAGNGIFNVKVDSIEKLKKQMVSNPYHLKKRLDDYFDKTEDETVDITYRVFFWMAFAGLEDKDAIRVTSDCVDFEKYQIHFEGHNYSLYKEGIEDFRKACFLSDFNFFHPLYTRRRSRADGNIIMRGLCNPVVDLSTIRPIINKKVYNKKNKETGRIEQEKTSISYNRIYLSGLFYRMYDKECANEPVDFSAIVAMDIKKTDYKLSKTRTLATISRKIEKEYITDYEKWKCALQKR